MQNQHISLQNPLNIQENADRVIAVHRIGIWPINGWENDSRVITLYRTKTDELIAIIQDKTIILQNFNSNQIKCGISGAMLHERLIRNINHYAQGKLQEDISVFPYQSKGQIEEVWVFEAIKLAAPWIRSAKENLKQANLQDEKLSTEFYQKALKNFKTALKIQITARRKALGIYQAIWELEEDMIQLEALEHFQKDLNIEQVFGEKHPLILISSADDYVETKKHYVGEFHIATRKILLPDSGEHPSKIAEIVKIYNIGLIHDALRNDIALNCDAMKHFNKALNICLQFFEENHPAVATIYTDIGIAYEHLEREECTLRYHDDEDDENAIGCYQKALKIRLEVFGENHPIVAQSYTSIGSVHMNLKKYELALEYYQNALRIRLKTLDGPHSNLVDSYRNVGACYVKLGEYQKALEYYFNALEICLQIGIENPPLIMFQTAKNYKEIGLIYDQCLGKPENAFESYLGAFKIFCNIFYDNPYQVREEFSSVLGLLTKIAKNGLALFQLQGLESIYEICVALSKESLPVVPVYWTVLMDQLGFIISTQRKGSFTSRI